MTHGKFFGGALGILFASCVLTTLHPYGNPQRSLRQPREEVLKAAFLPEEARRTLIAKCADCHSYATHWPAYSWAAPVSWMIERDVVRGREHLNLSRWAELSRDRQQTLEQEIVRQIKKGTMPPPPYRWMHRQADLNGSDRKALITLVPEGVSEPVSATQGDADRGRGIFDRRCSGCHATDSDREGPRLRGAYGRRAGSVPTFQYSPALRDSGVTWTRANLDRWLSDSDGMMPGSSMGFAVPKAQERSDLIEYLRSLQ
jgi:cytochrome c